MSNRIWDFVSSRLDARPDKLAVHGAVTWTNSELHARVLALAQQLEPLVRPGGVVAISVRCTESVLLAVLACARVGRAFVALDPDAPTPHNQFVLDDCAAAAVIEDANGPICGRPRGSGLAGSIDAAYVMYTSGSTGRPKGVVVSADALLLRLAGLRRNPGVADGASMLAMASPCFDIALVELLLPIYVGGTVVIAPEGARRDPEGFVSAVAEHGPDVVQATPSFWRLALAVGWRPDPATTIWSGGEPMTAELAARLLVPGLRLFNLYGPTETTLWATAGRVRRDAPISIGAPMLGLHLELRDRAGRLVSAAGAAGEIVLVGDGIADGYLDRPELSAALFGGWTGTSPARSYRTGDVGLRGPDGSVVFVGRVDDQVKIRGHRIELRGVEAMAESHPLVSEVAVVLREADNPARMHLAAFVVSRAPLTAKELRSWLVHRLPSASRPSRIVLVDALPRTPSGKVDRVGLAVAS